jgi:signal transduction histidine kinase
MRLSDLLRTTAFRWAAVVAAAFTALSLTLFAFVYWQTAGYEARELDGLALAEARDLAAAPPGEAAALLRHWLATDEHHVRYGLLVGADGRKVEGNVVAVPPGLPSDGEPRLVTGAAVPGGDDGDGDEREETMRGLALRLSDGRTAVLGLDTDELAHTQSVLLRALGLGLVPTVVLSLLGGMLLGRRALDHVAAMDEAIARILRGDIAERLPVRGTRDEFDRLARSVNLMLDDMERLLDEVRGVGDSIAHDLRTPLTRARVRLERSRDAVRNEAEFRLAIEEALQFLDQTFAIIAAILRIGEVEHGRRRAGFGRVSLGPLLREVADLYDPVAEDRGVALELERADDAIVVGDRDLLFEAIANLVDNAIKFSPPGGRCSIGVALAGAAAVIRVDDVGPGIPAAERDVVLKRFHRSERSRTSEGSGLGLSLVAAVVRLHGFALSIGDGDPGCRVEVRAPATRGDAALAAA